MHDNCPTYNHSHCDACDTPIPLNNKDVPLVPSGLVVLHFALESGIPDARTQLCADCTQPIAGHLAHILMREE